MDHTACAAAASTLAANWVGSSTIPAHGLYPHQWSWDTAFISFGHAISNISRARIELEELFAAQWSNGLVPHIVFNPAVPDDAYFPGADYWRSASDSGGLAPSNPQTSGIVNPPVHVSAVLNLLTRDPDSAATAAFAQRMYEPLARWLTYLLRERDPDGNGLVYIRHPWESGMDNSPAWDPILDGMDVPPGSIPPYNRTDLIHGDPADRPSNFTYDRFVSLMICARNRSYDEAGIAAAEPVGCPFLVEDVTFNAILAQALHDMALLARALPGRAGEVAGWATRAQRTALALGQQLWLEGLGMYASRDVRHAEPLSLRVVGGLSPLLLRFSAASQVNVSDAALHTSGLLRTLRSPSFSTRFPVPSLDARSANFSRRDYWRGPTWFNVDWLLARGMRGRPASDADARAIYAAMRTLVETSGFREYWDPINGSAHGTTSFSWTAALYLDSFCSTDDDDDDNDDEPPHVNDDADVDRAAPCAGYLVSGAGSSAVDGCYRQRGDGTPPLFVLDDNHTLYIWDGAWRLGVSGTAVFYVATAPTAWPPETSGGCGTTWVQSGSPSEGDDPCPAIRRTGLPPAPPVPPPPVPPAPPAPPMRLVWQDDFTGPFLNGSLWNVLEQPHRGGVYTRDNVLVRDGALVLRTVAHNASVDGVPYFVTSGAVNTSGRAEQRHGRWEARVKLPLVGGSEGYTLHSSLWLFSDVANAARSGCPQEIDVFEQYMQSAGAAHPASRAVANLHPFTGTRHSGCRRASYAQPRSTTATGDWTGNWTVFRVDWTENWIAMSVDGEPYALFDQSPAALAAFTDPLFLALTACVMQRLPPTGLDVFPLEYLVDWVRVYEWA